MANDLQLRVLLSAIDRATAPLRRIMQGSDATARALKATRERLKQLNAQQSDARAFRTQRGALEQVSTALAGQQARVKALAQQMAAAGNPTRALTRDYNRAIREAGFLKQQHLQQSQALQQLRTRLSNAGISTATSASMSATCARRSRRPMAPSTARRSAYATSASSRSA
ncbi:hypothetical protein P4238_12115 [Pseudomonas aeruginosa]|nr:hypothetical protein [Pseudomonas aeruginosa]